MRFSRSQIFATVVQVKCLFASVVVLPDEQQEAEPAASSCCSDTSPNSQSDGTAAAAEPQPDMDHCQNSQEQGDAETTNGSLSQTEPICGSSEVNTCGDQGAAPTTATAAGGSEPPSEQLQQMPETTEEDEEEDKQEEARSPSPPANEHPAKRRACCKRRRSLFTIQAVNSNGTTERGMGEGGSAVSFSCESLYFDGSSSHKPCKIEKFFSQQASLGGFMCLKEKDSEN